MKFHHIGYAVKDLDKGVRAFEALGYLLASPVTKDVGRKVDICFMTYGSLLVELVAPASKDSPVNAILASCSGTPYHFCYETDDLEGTIRELSLKGFAVFMQPEPAPAIGNRGVAFLYNTAIGVIEILEAAKSSGGQNGQ